MFQRGWFLVDVQDTVLLRDLCRVVQRYGVARAVPADGGGQCAELLSEAGRVAGVFVQLDDVQAGRASDWRQRVPMLPILALARGLDRGVHNRLQEQGIEVAMLPVQAPSIVSFSQRALSASFLPHDGVSRVVAHLAVTRHLTAREVQILASSLANEPRNRVRRRLGVAENTLKTQIRGLLRKCEERSVDALAKNVLRAALLSRAGHGAASCRRGNVTVAPWWVESRAVREEQQVMLDLVRTVFEQASEDDESSLARHA
jgi:DNA-binding CsgD family transcriptional regulator